jgi:hypothetical protein
MAVRPLRALLAAQAQSTWNRRQREAAEESVVAAALVALLASIAVAPPVYACFVVGAPSAGLSPPERAWRRASRPSRR